jgi:hypothetical protein
MASVGRSPDWGAVEFRANYNSVRSLIHEPLRHPRDGCRLISRDNRRKRLRPGLRGNRVTRG